MPKASGSESAHYFSFPTTEVQEICAKKSLNKLVFPQHLPLCLSISFIWEPKTFSPVIVSCNILFSFSRTRQTAVL